MNTKEQLSDRLNQAGKDVRETSRNVWLAGLGVVGTLDERGRAAFSSLVDRGEKVDAKADLDLLQPLNEAADRVKKVSEKIERQAQTRMSKTLRLFGMPSRDDVQLLIHQVEVLNTKVDGLKAAN